MLKSRLIIGRRKIPNSGGVFRERVETRTGEAMTQELGLGDGKFTLTQANCQAMARAQLQDVSEALRN